MTWWKGLIAGVLVLAVAGITVAGLRDRPPPATEVQVAKVRKGTITRAIIGAGKVEAATTVKISSNLSGDLVERPVKVGDKVKKGQVLGRIDRAPLQAAVKQAQAARERGPGRHARTRRSRWTANKPSWTAWRAWRSGAWPRTPRWTRPGRTATARVARLAAAQQRYQAQVAACWRSARPTSPETTLGSPIDGTVIELTPRGRRARARLRLLRGRGDDHRPRSTAWR